MSEGAIGPALLRISIIIPTFNRLDKLKSVIASLRRQSYPADRFEIIVVDDGSTDGTAAWLADAAGGAPNLRFEIAEHAGPAVARNVGVKMAEGEILLFLGDDTIASEDLLSKHACEHERLGCDIAIQGGVQPAENVRPTRFVRYLNERSHAQFHLRPCQPGDSLPFDVFYTCNCSLPKRLLDELGGFPEDVVYYDDTFVGYMLSRRGVPIIYEPTALVRHNHTQELNGFLIRQVQAGADAAVLSRRCPALRQLLRVDQAVVLEGSFVEMAKKGIKRLLFNRATAPLLKMLAANSLVPFPLACFIYSGLIGWQHRVSAQAALKGGARVAGK
ncbi:glycosyltransferase [bacterium]|nr:glycosyltransferase [bacterium]